MSDAELFTTATRISVENAKALFFLKEPTLEGRGIDPVIAHACCLLRSLGQRLLEAEAQGIEIEGEVDIRWSFSASKFPDQWNRETDAAMRAAILRRRERLWVNRKRNTDPTWDRPDDTKSEVWDSESLQAPLPPPRCE